MQVVHEFSRTVREIENVFIELAIRESGIVSGIDQLNAGNEPRRLRVDGQAAKSGIEDQNLWRGGHI